MEVVGLKLYDMDIDRGTLMVRQGKGKRDRMIPIGRRALNWIEKYITEVSTVDFDSQLLTVDSPNLSRFVLNPDTKTINPSCPLHQKRRS